MTMMVHRARDILRALNTRQHRVSWADVYHPGRNSLSWDYAIPLIHQISEIVHIPPKTQKSWSESCAALHNVYSLPFAKVLVNSICPGQKG